MHINIRFDTFWNPLFVRKTNDNNSENYSMFVMSSDSTNHDESYMFLCYPTTNPITDKVIGCVHALADVKNSTSNIYYKLIQNCCILLG